MISTMRALAIPLLLISAGVAATSGDAHAQSGRSSESVRETRVRADVPVDEVELVDRSTGGRPRVAERDVTAVGGSGDAARTASRTAERGVDGAIEGDGPNAIERGRYAILIDLDENRLYFKLGELTLWSAPVGTGTGMRVITDSEDWEFSTPTGRFYVQYKELDPVWIAPDWYFVENNLPVPPTNHSSRYMRGTLGAAAVYISPHLAIHGTNRPELIGQRVSHGCIRLENRYAMRLFHNVQVGTEVIIVGGEDVLENARVVDLREGYDPTLASRGPRSPAPVDARYEAWKDMDTQALISQLDLELMLTERTTRWDQVAILLLDRAAEGDEEAILEVLRRSDDLPASRAVEGEWATYLAHLYRQNAIGTLEGMSRLNSSIRAVAARELVEGMLTLFHDDFDLPGAPWPTSLIPAQTVTVSGRRGWDALQAAEREHRTRLAESLAQVSI